MDILKPIFNKVTMSKGIPTLILAVASANVIWIGGNRRTMGILVTAFHERYNSTISMTELNWIADSYVALAFFLIPFVVTGVIYFKREYQTSMLVAGSLVLLSSLLSSAMPSPGYLFVTHTFFNGLGTAIIIGTCALIVGEYFEEQNRFHVLATTLVSDGPLGVLIYGPIYATLIEHLGWRAAFVIMGCIFLAFCVGGMITFAPNPYALYENVDPNFPASTAMNPAIIENNVEETETNGRFVRKIVSNSHPVVKIRWAFCSLQHIKKYPHIMLWLLDRLLQSVIVYDLMVNLTFYATSKMNNEIEEGASINLRYGAGESIIFLIGVFVGDQLRGYFAYCYLIGAFLSSTVLIIMQFWSANASMIMALSILLGAAMGIGNTAVYAASEEIMYTHGSIAFSMSSMMTGLGMILSPFFSGAVIDRVGFAGYFVCQACLIGLRMFILIIIVFAMRVRTAYDLENYSDELANDPSRIALYEVVQQPTIIENSSSTNTTDETNRQSSEKPVDVPETLVNV